MPGGEGRNVCAGANDERTANCRFGGVSRASAGECRPRRLAAAYRATETAQWWGWSAPCRAAPFPPPLALPVPPAARRATPPARLPLSPENGTPFSISLFSISLPWGPVDPSRAATFSRGRKDGSLPRETRLITRGEPVTARPRAQLPRLNSVLDY